MLGTTSPTEITEAEAYALLRYVVDDHIDKLYTNHLDEIIGMSLNQVHAIVSFSYNVGNASAILTAMRNNANLQEAWITTKIRGRKDKKLVVLPGLVKRRNAEYIIYINGVYDSTH